MKISELIKEYVKEDFKVIEEKSFDTLGLIESEVETSFCTFIDSAKYLTGIPSNVKMILISKDLLDSVQRNGNFGLCIVENPRITFFKLHNALEHDQRYVRQQFDTIIGQSCHISPLASIAPKNVEIGNNVIIEEFVVIRENTKIGDNCILRSGCKLGGTDFEFKREKNGIFGVHHYGGLVIGNHVEVQYNSGINKALYPWDDTVLGDYTKIDMLVHVAHGVKIGKSCMVVANSGIGGRTKIGDECWIGFGSTIKNGITIGDHARVNMGAVVTKSVGSEQSVTGNFAIEHSKFIANMKSALL